MKYDFKIAWKYKDCTTEKKQTQNKPKHGKYYLNSLLKLFSHQQFSFPHSRPVMCCHFSWYMSNSLKPQPPDTAGQEICKQTGFSQKNIKTRNPEGFTEAFLCLFSTDFHKMTACFEPSQLLGCKEAWPCKWAPRWALWEVQTPKVKSPRSLHLCLKCLFQMAALTEGGKKSVVLKADIWDVLSGLSTTHCGGNFTFVESLEESHRSASYWDCYYLCCSVSFSSKSSQNSLFCLKIQSVFSFFFFSLVNTQAFLWH